MSFHTDEESSIRRERRQTKLEKLPSINDRGQTDRVVILANLNPSSPLTLTLNLVSVFQRAVVITHTIEVKGQAVQKLEWKQPGTTEFTLFLAHSAGNDQHYLL